MANSQALAVEYGSSERPWVLVIDDDPCAARSLARMLALNLRVGVRLADEPSEAVARLRDSSSHPIGIIADYDLAQKGTGLDVIQAVRSLGVSVPCLFWTGTPGKLKSQLSDRGITERFAICTKGLDSATLLSSVSKWIENDTKQNSLPKRAVSGVRRKVDIL